MIRFIEAVEKSIEDKNWYAALGLALMLPDMCGKIEDPDLGSQARYVKWFDEFLLHLYVHTDGAVSLSGDDCYALRCAFLHEGTGSIEDQKARDVLEGFHFVEPAANCCLHRNHTKSGGAKRWSLQLQVDLFCQDVCNAARAWRAKHHRNPQIQKRLKMLLTIQSMKTGIRL